MARKKTTTIIEDDTTPETAAVEIEQDIEPVQMSVTERLAEIMQTDGTELFSRIYREEKKPGSVGTTREFIGRVDSLVDEEFLAENYGGGRYFVRYGWREKGLSKNTSTYFNISADFRPSSVVAGHVKAPANNNPLAALLDGLTVEKVAGIMAAVEGIKKIFAPPPPPVDLTELLKVAFSNSRTPVSDAVIMKAMEVQHPAPAPVSILEQVKQIKQVKEILTEEVEEEKDDSKGGTMDFIKIGLQMLPAILQKNGGNYEATGAAVKDNPIISGLIKKDPELATKFITAARDEYGSDAARDLARGFGYEMTEQEVKTDNVLGTPQNG